MIFNVIIQETVAPEDPNAPKIEVVSPNVIVNVFLQKTVAPEDPNAPKIEGVSPNMNINVYIQETVAPEDPNAPKIEVVSPNVIVNEGDVASLSIRVNGSPKPGSIFYYVFCSYCEF